MRQVKGDLEIRAHFHSVAAVFLARTLYWRRFNDGIVFHSADGNFEVTLATKATLNYTGRVEWKPPAIYKSSCEIDVEYFPFDEQTCVMKFGSWTYDGFQVNNTHIFHGESCAGKIGVLCDHKMYINSEYSNRIYEFRLNLRKMISMYWYMNKICFICELCRGFISRILRGF